MRHDKPSHPRPAVRVVGRVKADWLRCRVRLGWLPSPEPWLTLAGRIVADPPVAVSIDVFDTVVVRPLVGERAWINAMASRLVGRSDAAEWARRRLRPIDKVAPRLVDIYGENNDQLGEDATPAQEVAFERTHLQAVPGARQALDRIRRVGTQVCFTSDMHLSGDDIRAILNQLGLAESQDLVLSSSDEGASKSDGGLFNILLEQIGCRAEQLVHLGDNPWADLAQPARAGITVLPARIALPNRYERAMAKEPGSAGPAIASAARSVRMEAQESRGREAPFVELGASIPGQVFTAFLLWVREQCKEAGIEHVAFLSRDGELPLKMARAMPSCHWDGIELSYLHMSRRVWQGAAVNTIGVERWIEAGTKSEQAFIHHYRERIPFISLLARVGLTADDLPRDSELATLGDRPLPPGLIESWESLLSDPATQKLISERAREREAMILRYLHQQGIGESPIALVDVGWTGRLGWMVSSLVRRVAGHEPLHLHFGGDQVSQEVDERVQIRRFALDDQIRPHPISHPVACIEIFTGSGHPRLLGYEDSGDGVIAPVLGKSEPLIDAEPIHLIWEGAIATAGALPTRSRFEEWGINSYDLVEEVRQVLSVMWNEPAESELEQLSQLYLDSDDVGESIDAFVAPYTLREITGQKGGRRKWPEGSLKLTWMPYRNLLAVYFRVRDRAR